MKKLLLAVLSALALTSVASASCTAPGPFSLTNANQQFGGNLAFSDPSGCTIVIQSVTATDIVTNPLQTTTPSAFQVTLKYGPCSTGTALAAFGVSTSFNSSTGVGTLNDNESTPSGISYTFPASYGGCVTIGGNGSGTFVLVNVTGVYQ